MHVCMYACMYACMYICTCVYLLTYCATKDPLNVSSPGDYNSSLHRELWEDVKAYYY